MSYLSYSGWKQFKSCPNSYCRKSVIKEAPVKPDNKVNSLYGSVVGLLAEQFYKDRLWRTDDPAAELVSRAERTLNETIERERVAQVEVAEKLGADKDLWREGAIVWSDPKANYNSREILLVDVLAAMPRLVEIIRTHKLLGPRVATELKLDADFGEHRFIGRADFIIRHVEPNVTHILDGKGSKYGGKYADPEQLSWYSMLWRKRTGGKLPDSTGFVLWRKPPAEAVEWHPIKQAEIDGLEAAVIADADAIETARVQYHMAKEPERRLAVIQEKFPVQPGQGCNLCSYLPVCEPGKIMTAKTVKAPEGDTGSLGAGVEDVGL